MRRKSFANDYGIIHAFVSCIFSPCLFVVSDEHSSLDSILMPDGADEAFIFSGIGWRQYDNALEFQIPTQ